MWTGKGQQLEDEDESDMNLNSNSLSTQFEDEYDGKKYSFDFNALKKVQRRERAKILIFMLVIFVLASALVVMTILYRNKMDANQDLSKTLTATKGKKVVGVCWFEK